MDYSNSFYAASTTGAAAGDFRAVAAAGRDTTTAAGHQQQPQQQQQQQPQQHHLPLPYDCDYDFAQQRLAALAATTDQAAAQYPPFHRSRQQQQKQQQQPTHITGASTNANASGAQQQVQQENQLMRQRLEQVQAQMQAARQQCLILQQQQQQQQQQQNDVHHRKRSASLSAVAGKKRKQTTADFLEEEEEEAEETQSEEEEEDSGEDEEDDEDDDEEEEGNHCKSISNNNNGSRNHANAGGHRLPTYGNRKDPIKTPKTNMIDGRSNAALAFEEKCNILRQYIAENGHANVPNPWSKKLPAKWQFLSRWIEKQFKFYRGMKSGKGTKHLGGGSMTPERAQMLKNLGVNLDARTNVEEAIHQFHYVHFPTLQAFHAQYGHCCVLAVLNIHANTGAATATTTAATITTDTTTTAAAQAVAVAAPFLDPEFKKWVAVNKVNLRNANAYDLMVFQKKQQQEQQQVDGDNPAASAAGNPSGEPAAETSALNSSNSSTCGKDSTIDNDTQGEAAPATGKQQIEKHPQEQPTQKDGDENAASDGGDEIGGNNNNDAEKKQRKQGKKREGVERAELKKAYWTDEMTQTLQSLNCPWMNEAFENEIKAYFKQIQQEYTALNAKERKRRKIGASFQTFPILNTHTWYENVELFRKYVHDHDGNGLVPVSSYDSMSGPSGRLGRFVKDQRKLYDAIYAGNIPSHPIVEQNFALLQAMGFVFDAETLRKDEERRCQENINQARAEKEKDSPWAKLEQEKKGVQEAKAAVAQAKAVVNEAQKALTKAHRELQTAYKRVRDQEAVVANDPMGKIVTVQSRGDKKPGGRGRVLAINKVKIVQQDITFYDVEYIDDDVDKGEEGKQEDGDTEDKDKSSSIADEANKLPKREYAVDAMFVTFEDARFNSNGDIAVAAALPKPPVATSGPDYNLRHRRPSPRQQQQQQQQKQATVLVPGFQHNIMLPPGPVAGQSDDYEDGMSLCI